MNVKEFIKWLKTQDQDATVRVVASRCGVYHYQDFIPTLSNYVDFRGNQFVKPGEPHENKRFLELGEDR